MGKMVDINLNSSWVYFVYSVFILLGVLIFTHTAHATTIGTSVSSTNVTSSGYIEIGDHGGDAGASFANGSLNVAGATFVGGALTLDGSVTIGDATTDTITVNARFASGLSPDGNSLYDLGAFDLAWQSIFASGTIYAGILDVAGVTILGNDATADTVTFNARIGSDLDPNANSNLDIGAFGLAWSNIFASGTLYTGILDVAGITILGDDATSDTITLNARFDSDLDPNANSNLDIGAFGLAWSNIYASGTLYTGILEVDGVTILGNDVTSDTITLNARIASDLNPNANNSLDIGAFGFAWKDIFASGTLYANTIQAPGNATIAGQLSANGNVALGDTESDVITINGVVGGDFIPNTNNSSALGDYGSAWLDFYVSSTIYTEDIHGYNPSGTSTLYLYSGAAGTFGSQIIMEDSDGVGCSVVYVNNGTLSSETIACPQD